MKKTHLSDPENILEVINAIRAQNKLPEISTQEVITKYAKSLSSSRPIKWKDSDSYVTISNMNFTELLDERRTSNQLVSFWMNNSNKRSVILAPGKYGSVVFSEHKGNTYVSVVIMSFFH